MKWPFRKKQTISQEPAWAAHYDDRERFYPDHMDYALMHTISTATRIASVIPINYALRRCQIGKIHIKPQA